MLFPTLFLLGLGLGAAIILSAASKIFYVWEDPKIMEVEDALLGANCGGCGYPGCSAAAAAVVAGKEPPDVCVAGGTDIALKVAAVMGMEVEIKEPEIAYSTCRYGVAEADTKFTYMGINDCRIAALYNGGPKECPIGCIGFSSCVRACPFNAITMGKDGLPHFDKDRCRACGICVEICPKDIIYLTSTTKRIFGDYKTDECTTPCQRACPSGIDIPAYIRHIANGDYIEAVRIIKERNPLPSIVGRICPAPCEMDCRRNLEDDPVGINNLKRFVADYERINGERVFPFKIYQPPSTENMIAVIGGGAQGLTTSYYLACLGHQPTIYESMPKLGGIIRNVIPKSRLPEEIIDWDIEGILAAGVKAETGKTIGKDFTINSLLSDGHKAVVLSTGGIDSRKILRGNIDLEQTIPGIYTLLDFMVNASNGGNLDIGKNVYITGGGSSTIEAALTCLNKGAKKAAIIYPYSSEDLISRKIDIEKAEKAGVKFLFNTVVTMINGKGEKLTGINIKTSDGETKELSADNLIVATGRLSDIVFTRRKDDNSEEIENTWSTLETYRMYPTKVNDDLFNLNENGVFNDNLAVIKSIGRGRRIARAVEQHLRNKASEAQESMIMKGMDILNVEEVSGVDNSSRSIIQKKEIVDSYCEAEKFYYEDEIEIGYTEETAKKEADRCLDCGLICYKKTVS